MKSIIVEGYDGCGKSTLARRLGGFFGLGVHMIGGPPKSDEQASTMANYQLAIAEHSNVVFDRITPLSRLCYEEGLDDRHVAVMYAYMDAIIRHSIVIWATVPKVKHEWKEYDTKDHINKILANEENIKHKYHEIMDTIPHIHYDYTEMSFEDLLEEVKDAINK